MHPSPIMKDYSPQFIDVSLEQKQSPIAQINEDVQDSKRVQEVVNNVLQEEYPHLNQDERYNQLFKQIFPGNELGMYSKIGEDVVEVIREKGVSSNKVIHLLASLCGKLTKNEAEKLINCHISSYKWSQARKHRRKFGSAMPKPRRKSFKTQKKS